MFVCLSTFLMKSDRFDTQSLIAIEVAESLHTLPRHLNMSESNPTDVNTTSNFEFIGFKQLLQKNETEYTMTTLNKNYMIDHLMHTMRNATQSDPDFVGRLEAVIQTLSSLANLVPTEKDVQTPEDITKFTIRCANIYAEQTRVWSAPGR